MRGIFELKPNCEFLVPKPSQQVKMQANMK